MPIILAGRSPSEGAASVAEFHDGAEQLAAGYLPNQSAIFNHADAGDLVVDDNPNGIHQVVFSVNPYWVE